MQRKYLDYDGLIYLWAKIKGYCEDRVDDAQQRITAHITETDSALGNINSKLNERSGIPSDNQIKTLDWYSGGPEVEREHVVKWVDSFWYHLCTKANGVFATSNNTALTGTPTAPTADPNTNNTQIATTAFVKTAIDNSLAGITGISYEVVTSLPTTGKVGVFYLVANSSGDADDSYNEYIWMQSTNKFELVGRKVMSLDGYVKDTDLVAITNSEIDTITEE